METRMASLCKTCGRQCSETIDINSKLATICKPEKITNKPDLKTTISV